MMLFQFKPLAQCRERQLLRVKINDDAQWAILGDVINNAYAPLIVLSGRNAPFCINVLEQGHVTGDFADYPVADFGTTYTFVPGYTGRSQIGEGNLFTKPGSLIVVEGELGLVVSENQRARHFFVQTGQVKGNNPASHRIAFENSYLKADILSPDEPLIRFGNIDAKE